MTTPPGRTTAHYDGDGCTGQPRTVDPDGADAIRYRAKRLVTRAASGSWPEAVIHGDWVSDHYGPPGEFFLSTLLAGYVRHGHQPPSGPGMGGLPQLSLTVCDGDLEAAALFEYLTSHRRLQGTPLEQCGALQAARLPLQTFLMFLHVGDTPAARRQWLAVYDEGARLPLVPAAFAALLTLWAARATFGFRQLTAQAAPLN